MGLNKPNLNKQMNDHAKGILILEADPLLLVPLPLSHCHVDPAPHGSDLMVDSQRQASPVANSCN